MSTKLNILQQIEIQEIDSQMKLLNTQRNEVEKYLPPSLKSISNFKRPEMEVSIHEAFGILSLPSSNEFDELRYNKVRLSDAERDYKVFAIKDKNPFVKEIIQKCGINKFNTPNEMYLTALYLVSKGFIVLNLDKTPELIILGFYQHKEKEIKMAAVKKLKNEYCFLTAYSIVSIIKEKTVLLF